MSKADVFLLAFSWHSNHSLGRQMPPMEQARGYLLGRVKRKEHNSFKKYYLCPSHKQVVQSLFTGLCDEQSKVSNNVHYIFYLFCKWTFSKAVLGQRFGETILP